MKKRRSAISIMSALIGLVKPLMHIMFSAIILGTLGYLCAIFLTILASEAVLKGLSIPVTIFGSISITALLIVMVVIAVLRGLLHYAEQYCNHYIAFRLLALIRHKVFAVLRKLCPAKLEGKERGNLISIITTDIELLEVFYAHTISPIAIAILTSLIMVIFIGRYHWLLGLFALACYVIVGALIPVWNGKKGGTKGMEYRNAFGKMNSFVLDSLRGVDETIQYGMGNERLKELSERSDELSSLQKQLNDNEGKQTSLTYLFILIASFGMLGLSSSLYMHGMITFEGVVIVTVAMMGSFGPTVALASLSNNLNQTLASGERVLSLLEEEPQVEEVNGESESIAEFTGVSLNDVSFAYDSETILDHFSMKLKPGNITGIHGASGSGKSTVLKLIMRFWDVSDGEVVVNDKNVKNIPTSQLRDCESYVEQETCLFHDSIAENIAIGKENATKEEIVEAAKKASLHEFVMSLPQGYDTKVGEMGDTLSGGEKQRIGIARAFLHDAPLLMLDEPTSNLDSLNEGIILKSLKKEAKDKTVVLVSHRDSTMRIADEVIEMKSERAS